MPKPKKTARREDPAVDQERAHDDAMRVLRAEYWSGVRGIVQDLKDRVASKEIASEDDLQDAVHQAVDGSYWVIYTHANFQVLLCSDHHDAYSEEYGEAPVKENEINWAAAAFAALYRDVQDQMGAEGVEIVEEARRRRVRESGDTIDFEVVDRGRVIAHIQANDPKSAHADMIRSERAGWYPRGVQLRDPRTNSFYRPLSTREVQEPRRLDSRLRAPRRSVRAPAGRRPRRR